MGEALDSVLQKSVRFMEYHIQRLSRNGKTLTEDMLGEYSGRGYTGFLVNIHEITEM